MRVQASFAFLVPLLASVAVTACGPEQMDDDWTAGSCYCDSTGCFDYDNTPCTPPSGSTSSGSLGGSSGDPDGGSSGSTSSSGSVDGGSSGSTSSSGSADGGSSGTTSSSGSADGGSSGTTSSGGSSGASSSSGGPTPNCSVDSDCGDNQTCRGGFCRFQCTTDDQCRLYDSRLDTCDNGICRQD